MEEIAGTSEGSQFGGQIGLNKIMSNPKLTKQFQDQLRKEHDVNGKRLFSDDTIKEFDGKSGAELAAFVAEKQAGGMKLNGMVLNTADGKTATVNAAMGSDGALRLSNVDASSKTATGDSNSENNSTKLDDSISIKTAGEFKSQKAAFRLAKSREPKDLEELSQFVESSDMAEHAKNKFFGNAVAFVAEKTHMSNEAVIATGAGMGGLAMASVLNRYMGGPVGKTVSAIRGKSKKVSNSKNQTEYDGTNHQDTQAKETQDDKIKHKNSFSSDIEKYTKDYAQSQESFNKESKNLNSLEKQKQKMMADGKDTTAIDEKIGDSKAKVDGFKTEMRDANSNLRLSQQMAAKESGMPFNSDNGVPKTHEQLSQEFKDIGAQKQKIAAQYNSRKMPIPTMMSKASDFAEKALKTGGRTLEAATVLKKWNQGKRDIKHYALYATARSKESEPSKRVCSS